jgi:hypothetical protein
MRKTFVAPYSRTLATHPDSSNRSADHPGNEGFAGEGVVVAAVAGAVAVGRALVGRALVGQVSCLCRVLRRTDPKLCARWVSVPPLGPEPPA